MTPLTDSELYVLRRLIGNELDWCDAMIQSTWDEEAADETTKWANELRSIERKLLSARPQPQVGM